MDSVYDLSVFFLVFVSIEKILKHSRQRLTTFPNNSKFVKNTSLNVVFSALFSVFGDVLKLVLSFFDKLLKTRFKVTNRF